MPVLQYNDGVLTIDSAGELNIGSPVETGATLNVGSSPSEHTILVGRDGGRACIQGPGDLICDSSDNHVSLNHFTSAGVRMAFGGGNVAIGTATPQNVTSGCDLTITGTIYNEGWSSPSLIPPWTQYSASWEYAGYWKDKNGMVYLRGMIKGGTSPGTYAFQLPGGYLPYRRELQLGTGHNGTAYYPIRIDILTDGNVYIAWPTMSPQTYPNWVSLARVSFRAYA